MSERERADDLAEGEELPLPGTEEPAESDDDGRDEPTEGPGNVSVDEPTQPAMAPDERQQ